MVAATLRRPGRALARLSLRFYPLFRRLTKVQAALLLALLLGEGVAFGAVIGTSAGERGTTRPAAVTVAGMAGAGPAAPAETAAPGVVLFTPSYPIGAAGQRVGADQVVLVEETTATGEAAR